MKRFAVALGALIVAGAVADLAFGRFNAVRARRQGELVERLEQAFRVAHPTYHHDLKPLFAGNTFWGPIPYTVRTDSLGFRNAAPTRTPLETPGRRLLLLGDSFTEGIGADYEATFAGRLAAALFDDGVEVLNAGVASYSPAIYWKKAEDLLERQKLRVDGVAVFIDVSDISDEVFEYRIDSAGRVVGVQQPDRVRPAIDFWLSNSLLATRLRLAREAMALANPPPDCSSLEDGLMNCMAAWTVGDAAMERYGRNGLGAADRHMSQLAALLRAHRVPLMVAVYPWPQQLRWNDRDSRQVSHWREWADREDAAFVELFTEFFAEADRLGVAAAVDRYYIKGDSHWSVAGHRLVANAIEPKVRSWLTPATAPASSSPRPISPASSGGSRRHPDTPWRAR